MTAHFIAMVVESQLSKIDTDNPTHEQIVRFNISIGLLEEYLRLNFLTFVETELVYKFGKMFCERRNSFECRYRAFGWYYTKKEFLKKTDKYGTYYQ